MANYGTKRDLRTSERYPEEFLGGFITLQLGATILSLTLYVLLCLTLPSMQNPVAYILGLSLVSKGLDIFLALSGIRRFSQDYGSEYHGQTGWSHLHLLVCQICQ